MPRSRWLRVVPIAGLAVAGLLTQSGMAAAAAPQNSGTTQASNVRVCPAPPTGYAACDAIAHTSGKPNGHKPGGGGGGTPSGYGPGNLQTAYGLAGLSSSETVAIVDAYNDPNVQSDLNTYRSYYGLPGCTSSEFGTTGCLTVVNQTGGAGLPRGNAGWGEEISLDVDMVSAICPNCHILLVEASSNSMSNLLTADSYAAGKTSYISDSWSGGEFSGETSYDATFTSGHVFTFATGDSGYGAQYPATSPNVIAVGGTTLTDANGSYSQTAWSGAGSGCSAYESQQSWQAFLTSSGVCLMRAEADVSAEADPNTGVSVYDSYQESGWMVFGGTSVATPIIASVYALAGNTATAASLYSNAGDLTDVTSGSNGSCGAPLCKAGPGWDGPTGLGTPNGSLAPF